MFHSHHPTKYTTPQTQKNHDAWGGRTKPNQPTPCKHGICAILNEKHDPHDYVDECYTVEAYKRAYAGVIRPINGQLAWGPTMFIPPLLPQFGNKPGRPSKLKRKGQFEPVLAKEKKKKRGRPSHKLRRFQTTVHCHHCGEAGHNVSNCPELGNQNRKSKKRLFDGATFERGQFSRATNQAEDEIDMHADDERYEFPGYGTQINVEHHEFLPPVIDNITSKPAATTEMTYDFPISQQTLNFTYSDAPTMNGPPMYEQLRMGNPQMPATKQRSFVDREEILRAAKEGKLKPNSRKKSKTGSVKFRIPPQLSQDDIVLSQASITGPPIEKNIIIDKGKKFLDLSGKGKGKQVPEENKSPTF